ncbi:MAG: hypothetical protein WBN80_08980, partial [Prochlorococcaceae cyanobacterium]
MAELQHFHITSHALELIGHRRQSCFEQADRLGHIGAVVELGHQFHPAEFMHGIVLDGVAEQLAVGHDVAHGVRSQHGGHEHADFFHSAGDAGSRDEIADAEWTEYLQENRGGKVAEHAAPGRPDRHAGAGQQSGKACCFNPEEAEDG